MSARYIVGDVFDVLRSLPENSVDFVMTSPPFLALRSYLPADHPDKAKEIGSEPTPAEFIDTLLDVVEELDRIVAPHGSIAIELGDTYAGSGGRGEASLISEAFPWREDGWRSEVRNGNSRAASGRGWPLAKSLCLIPESFRWALAYGKNPFTGRETPRWKARNVVRWHRPNPPVGALGDKFRPATTDLVIACKSNKRYFDLDAVRYQAQGQSRVNGNGPKAKQRVDEGIDGLGRYSNRIDSNESGAPPLDTWIIPTEPYKGAHYATFPSDLCVKPIKAMCPEKVCLTCGEPSRRIVESGELEATPDARLSQWDRGKSDEAGPMAANLRASGFIPNHIKPRHSLGWTDCGHDNYRQGVTFDPFAGSGTTLAVATGHGRDAIGIDIDSRNAELALDRVGPMLLTVETFGSEKIA